MVTFIFISSCVLTGSPASSGTAYKVSNPALSIHVIKMFQFHHAAVHLATDRWRCELQRDDRLGFQSCRAIAASAYEGMEEGTRGGQVGRQPKQAVEVW